MVPSPAADLAAVLTSGGQFRCSEGRREFRTLSGCRQRQRLAHADAYHAQGAAVAAASAARAWSSADDQRLWADFLTLRALPAPLRYARLAEASGRSVYSILQRLTLTRGDLEDQ